MSTAAESERWALALRLAKQSRYGQIWAMSEALRNAREREPGTFAPVGWTLGYLGAAAELGTCESCSHWRWVYQRCAEQYVDAMRVCAEIAR